MSEYFKSIMRGLNDVKRYINGEREGFVVHYPKETDPVKKWENIEKQLEECIERRKKGGMIDLP